MLELTVFLSGAFVMVLEMVGGRILAPHVGTSAIVWTSIIGVVLAFLALGAFAGGMYADRNLSRTGLARTLVGAAVGCAITAFSHASIGEFITSIFTNIYIAAIISAFAMFALPAFFFGMITPYVIRLRIASVDTAGATVGRLYALSTTGSILGTFLGGFILISWFSSTTILWADACSMLLLAILNSRKNLLPKLALLAIFLFLAWQDHEYNKWLADNGAYRLVESPYNSIRIMEGTNTLYNNARIRLMATDPGYAQSGMLLDDPAKLYFDYTKFYALGPQYNPDAKSILMLGGGGYSVPKWLLAGKSVLSPDFNLTVVEIDPRMTETAKKYFALHDDPRMKIIHEDARSFLNRQKEKYDLIFIDVFNSHYSIPFQMGTIEAVQAMKNALSQDGVLVMNVISAIKGDNGRLFQAIWQNMKKIFSNVKLYCVNLPMEPEKIQNLIILATDNKTTPEENYKVLKKIEPDINAIMDMEKLNLYKEEIMPDVPPLTDEFAPVDRYTLMLANE